MSYRVEFKQKAIADLESLTKIFQERIIKKIKWLAENFNQITPQPLSANLSSLFKLRVGDYRVIYSVDQNAEYITVHRVGHRREIYNLKSLE